MSVDGAAELVCLATLGTLVDTRGRQTTPISSSPRGPAFALDHRVTTTLVTTSLPAGTPTPIANRNPNCEFVGDAELFEPPRPPASVGPDMRFELSPRVACRYPLAHVRLRHPRARTEAGRRDAVDGAADPRVQCGAARAPLGRREVRQLPLLPRRDCRPVLLLAPEDPDPRR